MEVFRGQYATPPGKDNAPEKRTAFLVACEGVSPKA